MLTLMLLIFFVQKMLSAYHICCIYSNASEASQSGSALSREETFGFGRTRLHFLNFE